jgi:hypothetical protein
MKASPKDDDGRFKQNSTSTPARASPFANTPPTQVLRITCSLSTSTPLGCIDYFDAFLIGLTAPPDNRTYGFFKKNLVSDYSHKKAVADGVNVGNEVYTIETEITQNGNRQMRP